LDKKIKYGKNTPQSVIEFLISLNNSKIVQITTIPSRNVNKRNGNEKEQNTEHFFQKRETDSLRKMDL